MYINDHYYTKYLKFIKYCSSLPNNSKDEDYELHHIVPKAFGGTNDLSNLIKLTYRQHFIAHLFLAKSYPYSNIGAAVYYFIYSGKQNTIIKTSRMFEFAKRAAGIIKSSWFNDGNNNYKIPSKIGIDLGFNRGRISTEIWKNNCCVNDGIKNYIIPMKNLDNYLRNGYFKGMIKKYKIIPITNGDKNTAMSIDIVDEFLKQNKQWFLGHTVKSKFRIKDNCIRMHLDDIERNIPIEDIHTYQKQGWLIGRSDKSKKSCSDASNQIYLNDLNKRVNDIDLPEYLSLGWKLGIPESRKDLNRMATAGKIIVHNLSTNKEKRILQINLNEFESNGWIKGRHPNTILKSIASKKQGTIRYK